jgi:hypothetical protein
MSTIDRQLQEWQRTRHQSGDANIGKWQHGLHSLTSAAPEGSVSVPGSLLSNTRMGQRGNGAVRHNLMQSAQQSHGNRAVQRVMRQSMAPPQQGSERRNGLAVQRMLDPFSWDRFTGGRDPFTIEAGLGSWDTQNPNGSVDTRYGGKVGGGLIKGTGKYETDSGYVAVDVGAGSAAAEASIGDDGFTLGAGVNYAEGSVTSSTTGTDHDESTRVGLSAGPSFGVRGHWGDKDGDGIPEYGGGIDLGFFSMDAKTEDPLRSLILSDPNTRLLDAMLPEDQQYKGNMTQQSLEALGGALGGLPSLRDLPNPFGPDNPYDPYSTPELPFGWGGGGNSDGGIQVDGGLLGPHEPDILDRSPGTGGNIGPSLEEPLSRWSGGGAEWDPISTIGDDWMQKPPGSSGGAWDLPFTGGGGVREDPAPFDMGDWF